MNWTLLGNSLLVGSLTSVFSVCAGFVAALCLAGLPARWRVLLFAGAIVALALPPFLVTNCWLHYLGQVGVWRGWLNLDISSLGGSIWILTLLLWPLSLLMVWGAWQQLEPAHLESDMLLTGSRLIKGLLLPVAREALLLAALLTLTLALNNFGVPAILQVKVLPAEMWIRFNTEFDTWGALRSTYPLFIAPALLLFFFSRRKVAWPNLNAPVSDRLFRHQLEPAWFWASVLLTIALLGCSVVLPLLQILSASRTWSELPGAVAAGRSAIWNSLWYAGAAATFIMCVGLIAVASATFRPRCKISNAPDGSEPKTNSGYKRWRAVAFWAWVNSSGLARWAFACVGWLAFLLPGVVLGIGLIYAFNHDWSARLYQSAGIVIVAFFFRYVVIGWYAAGQALRRVDRDLIDVAMLEGANRRQLLRHVAWPQIARPMWVAWYVIFLFCLWDVESMILIVPPGGETLALRVFNLLHYGHNAQVNALCLVLLLGALLPLALASAMNFARLQSHRARKANAKLVLAASARAISTGIFSVFAGLAVTSCSPSNEPAIHSQLFDQVQIIGSRGVGVGQLNKPRSVAVDLADDVYVVDMTGRVQKFSSNGLFLLSWQMPQTDRGKPKGMGRDLDGNIFVVEPHYSRVNVFSPSGKLLAQWGSHGTNAGELSMPRAVAENSQREIFVSEYQEIERVQKFASSKLAAEAGDARGGSGAAPVYLGGFGQAGTGPGDFNRPEGVSVDNQDRVYVADSCNHRIEVFARDGKFLLAYGKPGQGLGELSYPYDICVDKEGRQYVCEFGNSRIQVFDSSHKPIEIIGGPGSAPGQFSNPWGVALDSGGNLYVADSQNHRLQKLIRKR